MDTITILGLLVVAVAVWYIQRFIDNQKIKYFLISKFYIEILNIKC